MAGGGDNGEMNPFISYVDLFSSVILVLLLFVLIMFVNVGYYMQFNSKGSKSAVSKNIIEEKTTQKEDQKITFVSAKEISKDTPIQSTNTGENELSKSNEKVAVAEYKESDLLIVFQNNEYFVSKDILSSMAKTMDKIVKTKPNAMFVISIGDSKKLISSTQTKQVSLGRVLSLKNSLDAIPSLKNKIKINYKQQDQMNFEFGYLKVDVK